MADRAQGYNPYPEGKQAPELRMPGGFSRNIPEVRSAALQG